MPYKHIGRGLCLRCYRTEPDVHAKHLAHSRKWWAGLSKVEKKLAMARSYGRRKARMKSDPEYRNKTIETKAAYAKKRYHSDGAYRQRRNERNGKNDKRRRGTDTGLPINVRSAAVIDDLIKPYLDKWAKLPFEEPRPTLPPKNEARKTEFVGRPPSGPKKVPHE